MTVIQAEVDLRDAEPRYVEIPVKRNATVTEWHNMAAQDVLSSAADFGVKNGSEPQPGNECCS
jgi:hypothetical protein